MRHEVPHQYLALSRDVPQLRGEGNRIPGGLRPFVGHSSLLLLTGLTRAVSVTSKKTNTSPDAVRDGESRFPSRANLGRLTNVNTIVEKATNKGRSTVVAPQLNVVRCETLLSCLRYNFAQCRKGANGAAVPMLQGGPDAHVATRQTSSSSCPKRSNLPYTQSMRDFAQARAVAESNVAIRER
jgi:hypothetical protein